MHTAKLATGKIRGWETRGCTRRPGSAKTDGSLGGAFQKDTQSNHSAEAATQRPDTIFVTDVSACHPTAHARSQSPRPPKPRPRYQGRPGDMRNVESAERATARHVRLPALRDGFGQTRNRREKTPAAGYGAS